MPIYVETHRNRMTTDLLFTLDLIDRVPEMCMLADLSHVLLGREYWYPIRDEDEALVPKCSTEHGHFTAASHPASRFKLRSHSRSTRFGSICSSAGGNTASEAGESAQARMRFSRSHVNLARGPMALPIARATIPPTVGRKPYCSSP